MRVGLAGFGAWGRMHARVYAQMPGVELAGVFCHGDDAAQLAASTYPDAVLARRWEDLLALSPDVVAVTVPNHLHARFAVSALESGAHVILEKPLGTTLAECDAVLAAAQTSGRRVAVNHELRVSQQWRQVREIIAAGEIGRVTYQHLSLFRRPFRPGSGGWRQDPARVGSYSLEELVHFVDLVMWYAHENGLPERATVRAGGDNATMPQTLSALLDWRDGTTALVSQCLAGFQHHTLLEIAGSEGAIRTSWSGAFDRAEHPSFSLWVQASGDSDARERAIAFSGELFELEQNLARALASFGGAAAPMSLAEARNAVALCLAIDEAGRKSEPVALAGYWA